jgi:hypothetical protein
MTHSPFRLRVGMRPAFAAFGSYGAAGEVYSGLRRDGGGM